jgi:hypothetical protein
MKEVEYDGDGLDLNLDDENVTIDCDINPEKITDLHNELRGALIDKIEDSGDYSYPETEDFSISGVFTEDPDFDVLEELCDHTCEEADSDYDGDWSASQLLDFLKDEIGDKEAGDRYYISPSFGGLTPVLALLPFLAAYSNIHSLEVTFTHDKWERRGDYSASEHVGIKLKGGEFAEALYLAYLRYYRLMIGIIGSTFFISLFHWCINGVRNKLIDTISKYGQYTLGIYILQTFILESLMVRYINFDNVNSFIFGFIIAPLLSLLLLVICIFLSKILDSHKITAFLFLGKRIK